MSNRVIKEKILTSNTVAKLSSDEERHMVRMLLSVDDHGCLEVTPDVLRARLYPKILNLVTEKDVERWTATLVHLGILLVWSETELVGATESQPEPGRTWGVFPKFDENSGQCFTNGGKRTRNGRKTPTPPSTIFLTTRASRSQEELVGANTRSCSVPVPISVPVKESPKESPPLPSPEPEKVSVDPYSDMVSTQNTPVASIHEFDKMFRSSGQLRQRGESSAAYHARAEEARRRASTIVDRVEQSNLKILDKPKDYSGLIEANLRMEKEMQS